MRAFHDKVKMVLDPEIDRAYPRRWMGRVTVKTRDGRTLEKKIASPKGDPDNCLTRAELEDKALRLAQYAGGATEGGDEAGDRAGVAVARREGRAGFSAIVAARDARYPALRTDGHRPPHAR